MTPSKDWMAIEDYVNDPSFEVGVNSFLDYAFQKLGTDNIRCPCCVCVNGEFGDREKVRQHLLVYGVVKRYTFWFHHGERLEQEPQLVCDGDNDGDDDGDDNIVEENGNELDEMLGIIRDLYPECNNVGSSLNDSNLEEPNADAKRFYNLLKDSQDPVYEGCKSSRMSALLKLLHIKTLGRWTNESFNMLLDFLKEDLLPKGSNLPKSYNKSKKVMKDLGLSYQKIDACVNDCMLYWKENEKLNACDICGASRWKSNKHNGEEKCKSNGKRIPHKTLRYFPLKPRLQRLFMCSKTASLMTWHHGKKKKDGTMRHPVDGTAWESFDTEHPNFASDPRNVRLGLASDGFQPFANSNTSYSIWPVILIPYNVPPELCMKQSNMILSMLISGPKGPGDAIDVYLQPLIEELKDLWEVGVQTFDAATQRHFQLRAALMWTINDFPAYAMLSGWSTKGYLACPCCLRDTRSMRLPHGGKECYVRHRCYLPMNHRWRKDKKSFDGTVEREGPPQPSSIDDILNELKDLENIILSKDPSVKKKISHEVRGDNWNKKSIFFELPYWKTNLLRHNLDVMHIEKKICDSVLGTIMNIQGKTKDTLKSRHDLKDLGVRPTLHPIKVGDKWNMPPAPYTFSSSEKQTFCNFLKELKVPDGFSSNISYCVNSKEAKISGLKSHDCHVILEHLLPLAIHGLLTLLVREALIELSLFFTLLCAKVLNVDDLK
ncbi:uncharacterized protein [Spinacia oleracea]|uniref:Transposase-associated domain-containing protein n=1 Tax=Spinacia oleracea TaxID=3562 RepID=A0A9R0IGC7_SPIOL|nr:uncharacterized protein LOC110788501 [Spinacia oleracea]